MSRVIKEVRKVDDNEIVNIELSDLMTENNGLSFEVLSEEHAPNDEKDEKKEKE